MGALIKMRRHAAAPWSVSGVSSKPTLAYMALVKAFSITRHLGQHFQLSQLLGQMGLLDQRQYYPGLRYRYLRKYYLGTGFSIRERLQVAINHHHSMARHFRPDCLAIAYRSGHALWRCQLEDLALQVTLRMPYVYNHDGDLCLSLDVNGENVSIMTFSLAPGAVVGIAEPQVLLVSGIQGIAGKIGEVRRATELCNNVAPAHMLLFAASALAAEIGLQTIVGMGQRRVRGTPAAGKESTAFDYDAFWMHTLGEEQPGEFYRMALPYADKPIESVPAKHRSRARKRRELRNIIRHDIESQAHQALLRNCIIENNTSNDA